jgi:hypothetical protein
MSRDPHLSVAIDAACDAATEALAAASPDADGPDVRLVLIATVGDPSDGGHTEVRLAAPDGTLTEQRQKVAMIITALKAIAPELYDTMMSGLDRSRNPLRRRGH